MYNFNKILVTLDHTDLDKELIEAAAFISLLAKTKEVHFINVIKNVNIPKDIKKEFPNLIKDALRDRKNEIQRIVDRYFVSKDSKIKIEIKSGQATKSILKYSATQDIDLILLGRKNDDTGDGVIIQRLARRAGSRARTGYPGTPRAGPRCTGRTGRRSAAGSPGSRVCCRSGRCSRTAGCSAASK